MIIPETIDKVTKPVEYNGDFIIVKLVKKIPSKPLLFASVSELAKKDYVLNQKQLFLKQSIDKLMKNFQGYDIGFVNENKLPTIKDLTQEEIQQLVTSILNSQTTINSLMIGNKAIVYKITDSKFLNTNIDKDFMELTTLLKNVKNNEVIRNLIKQLKTRYKVISNMKAQ
jgi:peptidyl-prolyl cis-trans isomerase D